MSHRYRIFRNVARGGGFYVEDTDTGKQQSLRTKQKSEAERLVNVRNEAARIGRAKMGELGGASVGF